MTMPDTLPDDTIDAMRDAQRDDVDTGPGPGPDDDEFFEGADLRAELEGRPVRADDTRAGEVRLGIDLHRVLEDTSRAMTSDPLLFERDRSLVSVIGAQPDVDATAIAAGSPVVRTLSPPSLLPRLTRHVRFLRAERPSKKELAAAQLTGQRPSPSYVECMPPQQLVSSFLELGEWPGLRRLVGITETPSLRPDGTVIDRPGYDAATGFLYVPSARFDAVPDVPTQGDAARALLALADVFCDFPFATEAARYVPIAALLSIMARPAIRGAVPMFVFDAPTPGTGKSMCSDAACIIATGRGAPRGSFPIEKSELEKALNAAALAGVSVVGFDNVGDVGLGGDALDKCITAHDTVSFRILGKTEQRSCVWRAVILASGNNVQIVGDTMRRALVARIEAAVERPEDRGGFKHDPLLPWVESNRARLVAAALTVLRGYAAAGMPDVGVKPWGSFEAWGKLVPSAIVWAGGADVMGSRPSRENADGGDQAALAVLIRELRSFLSKSSQKGTTGRALVRALYPGDRPPGKDEPPDGWDTLRGAIETLAPPRGASRCPDTKAFGWALRKFRQRVVGGARLTAKVNRDGVAEWSVEDV